MGAMDEETTPTLSDSPNDVGQPSDGACETGHKPVYAFDDIPGVPPFDPAELEIEPSGFDLIWDFVRGIFGRRSHDRAA